MSKIKEAAILKIVTHSGKAHRDEFLAIAMVLASLTTAQVRQVVIERRNPKPEDTLNNGVLVLDIGGGDFDHHQLPSDAPACCALTLVLKDLGLLDLAREVWPWLEFVEVNDSKGPGAVAARLGVPWEKLTSVSVNPVEQWALHWFADNANNMKDVLCGIGSRLLEELRNYQSAMAALQAHARVEHVRGVVILDLSFTSDTTAVNKWRMTHCPTAKGSIMKDERGGGYTLYAWQFGQGAGWLDFRRIAGMAGVGFVHNGGFLAKTRTGLTFREALYLMLVALPSSPMSCGSHAGPDYSVTGSWSAMVSPSAPASIGPQGVHLMHFEMETKGTQRFGHADGKYYFSTEAALRTAMGHLRNRIDTALTQKSDPLHEGEVVHA